MKKISIISSSIRDERASHRVALFFENYIRTNELAHVEILDLLDYNFPLFQERLKYQKNPEPKSMDFAEKINHADGVIIVTPEYNGGYPASLKNAIDLLTSEWVRKPVAIATVSSGSFGGNQVMLELQFVMWKIGALVSPYMFPVPKVKEHYMADGEPVDAEAINKRADHFVTELFHWINTCEIQPPR